MKYALATATTMIAGVSATTVGNSLMKEIPCQYLHNGAWYNLATTKPKYFKAHIPLIESSYVQYSYCQDMNTYTNANCTADGDHGANKASGKFFASTGPTGWGTGNDCYPLTNSSLDSITAQNWTGFVEGSLVNNTFGLHYSSSYMPMGDGQNAASLSVGLICDLVNTNNDVVTEGPLEYNPLTNAFSTWNKSHKNCSIYQNSGLI